MSSNSRRDDRRYSKSRDRDSSRRSSHSSSRGRSPSPPATPRDENQLPTEFGRPSHLILKEDENTVLRRMKTAFTNSPLSVLNDCIEQRKKIQILIRNSGEIRGILTGLLIAFDKHWNMVLSDVEEIYVKPKWLKTPFLETSVPRDFPELKTKKRMGKVLEEGAKEPADEEAAKEEASKAAKKKRDRKMEKPPREVLKRRWNLVLLRGDNVVSFSPFEKGRTFEPPE